MTQALVLAASILCVTVAGAPAAAHLFEMRSKLDLDAHEYLVAQKLYRGWALFGFAVAAALATTATLAWTSRGSASFASSLGAFACVAATQVLFWTFTAPSNRRTRDWTKLPPDWERVRRTWEHSHAAAALLYLAALLLLLATVVLVVVEAGS
jgi:hypothetical protein